MIYKNYLLINCILIIVTVQIHAQRSEESLSYITLGANLGLNFSPNGNTYGLLFDISKPLFENNMGTILFNGGLQEDFQIQLERGFEGTTGSTIINSLHLTLGPSFYFLKSQNLFLSIKIFGGWSYKTTNGKIDNPELNIDRSYSDSYNYLSRGFLIQTGYSIRPDIDLSAFLKTDLRRLTDGDKILEYPKIVYGIGIIKKINCH